MQQINTQVTTNNIKYPNTCKENQNLDGNNTKMQSCTKPLHTNNNLSFDNNLQLYPKLNDLNVQSTKSKVTEAQVCGNKLILDLKDYLTLFENEQKLDGVIANNLNENLTCNEKSDKSSMGLETDQPKLKNNLVDKRIKNSLIVKKSSENQIHCIANKTKQPLKIITEKSNNISVKADNLLSSKHLAMLVKNNKPFILKQMPSRKIQLKTPLKKSLIANRNKVKINKKNSLLEQENRKQLRTVFQEKNNTEIFPVALKRSGIQDFRYITLLNNSPSNESEMQILGI